MVLLLKLGSSFLRLVEFDSDTIYSQYPLAEESHLVTDQIIQDETNEYSAFEFYTTNLRDLLLICPSVTFINPIQVSYSGLVVGAINQQNPIKLMRDFEATLLYQLVQEWPEKVILDAPYRWQVFIEVEEFPTYIEVREVLNEGSLKAPIRGKVRHTLTLFHSGLIKLDKKRLTDQQFSRVNAVFSLIGYPFKQS